MNWDSVPTPSRWFDESGTNLFNYFGDEFI